MPAEVQGPAENREGSASRFRGSDEELERNDAQGGICLSQRLRRTFFAPAHSQHEGPPEQSQLGSVPVSAPMMIAAAHPTPDSTAMASAGQFLAQAPHSMQASRSTIRAFLSSTANTPCGHTVAHIPQPVHFVSSNFNVTTFGRYRRRTTLFSFAGWP